MMPIAELTAAATAGGAIWGGVYQAAYAVRSQWLGATTWRGRMDTSSVALTFDDGPADDTEAILELLARNRVSATFFLIGERVERRPALARRIVDAGHEIGNHSYSHPIYLYCRAAETHRQLARTQAVITDATGVTPTIARPPCGVRTPAYFRSTRALGLRTVQWSATGYDWQRRNAATIAASVLDESEAGGIVLLHDGATAPGERRHETVRALPVIIDGFTARGLRCARVSELASFTHAPTAHAHS